jgi:hypothetical protein
MVTYGTCRHTPGDEQTREDTPQATSRHVQTHPWTMARSENLAVQLLAHALKLIHNLPAPSAGLFTDYAKATATHKAVEVATRMEKEGQFPFMVIGADTVVGLDRCRSPRS